jgi:callose synthase
MLTFLFLFLRTVDDFNDWTRWLMYRGGVGIKQEVSWEAWWEEQVIFVPQAF